jgi:D-sedoheptulose 7-phosphate isomerase
VVRALEQARSMKVATASFTGSPAGPVGAVSNYNVSIPSQVTARIQEMHITLAHMLCAALEKKLGFA